jgi:hypothetical protein
MLAAGASPTSGQLVTFSGGTLGGSVSLMASSSHSALSSVPEPGGSLALGVALLLLGRARRRSRRRTDKGNR